jgi:hypothetical protein
VKDCAKKLPQLLARLGLGECARKSAHCPFHDDEHESFSVFQSKDGKGWQWKCHARCGYGDEIALLVKRFGISRREAITRYLQMACFPPNQSSKSREYPQFPKSPMTPVVRESPVSHVSEGQMLDAEVDRVLKARAAQNACTGASDIVAKKHFKLARDVTAVQKILGHKLNPIQLRLASDEWHRLSEPYLDPAQTCDDYFIAFLAELGKVKVPTGEGTIMKALRNVSKLSDADLPSIPGWSDAPTKCRRIYALHRELSRLCSGKLYFLTYRDAAKVCDKLSHQEAHTITGALETLGVIEIVCKGKAGLNGGEAAEFRYLLSQSENGEAEIAA